MFKFIKGSKSAGGKEEFIFVSDKEAADFIAANGGNTIAQQVSAQTSALAEENTKLKAENAKLVAEAAEFPKRLAELEKSLHSRASRLAADIAMTAGLDAPIPCGGERVSEVSALRERLAHESDPTKKANLAREIKRLTTQTAKPKTV